MAGVLAGWLYGDLLGRATARLGGSVSSERFALFTLGFAPIDGVGLQAFSFVEAALGLGMVALLITYLPAMYSAFSRRETLVALLEVRAGSPPSAVKMLERFHRIGWIERLTDVWQEWEVWFAEVEESHTTYPILTCCHSRR